MKTLQEFADFLNGCSQCARCKHLAYVEDSDYMECSLGIEELPRGKCEKFEKRRTEAWKELKNEREVGR